MIVFSIASIASTLAALGKRVGSDWGSQSLAGRLRRTADKSNSQATGRMEACSGSFYRLRMIHPRLAGIDSCRMNCAGGDKKSHQPDVGCGGLCVHSGNSSIRRPTENGWTFSLPKRPDGGSITTAAASFCSLAPHLRRGLTPPFRRRLGCRKCQVKPSWIASRVSPTANIGA